MAEYLYHYTNLETLNLILKNKTFRLSSLSRMDDLEEGDTTDFQKLGRFIYVSSWTDNSTESSHLWNYSRGNDGVRIRMKPSIFKTERINKKEKILGVFGEINDIFNIGLFDLMLNTNIVFMPSHAELIRVTYTDLDRLLKPTVFIKSEGKSEVLTKDLGIFKRVEWQDQREWRYRLCSMPLGLNELFSTNHEDTMHKIQTREDMGFIDLPLREELFDDFEVLCSPNMTESGKIELYNILNKFAPNTTVKSSKMRIRL